MSVDKLFLAAAGVVGLKVFAGVDVLGMLGLNIWGDGTAPVPPGANTTTPAPNSNANTTVTAPVIVGGGSGVATYNTGANNGRPTGTSINTSAPAPVQTFTNNSGNSSGNANNSGSGSASAATTTTSTGRNAGNGNVAVTVNTTYANNAWLDQIGANVERDLMTAGLKANFDFHQWNYLFAQAGSSILPSPEVAGMGDGTDVISLAQYKTAIRSYAGLGGMQSFTGSRGMGNISLQPATNPNSGAGRANPVERMPFTFNRGGF